MQSSAQRTRGFTLIELLVVIAIIGVLATITMVSLSGAKPKARDSQRITEITEIALALELYYNACKRYPAEASGMPSMTDVCGSVTLANYLSSMPTDPLNSGSYVYQYQRACSNSCYLLRAPLETNDRALVDDVDNAQRPSGTSLSCDDGSAPYGYCRKG